MSRILLLHEFGGANELLPRLIFIVRNLGHEVVLLEEKMKLGQTIAETITQEISRADAAIVLISKGGPNIFYELGMLSILKKPAVLLVNARISLPSDLANIAHIRYDSKTVKSDTFEYKLRSHLQSTLRYPTKYGAPSYNIDKDFYSDEARGNLNSVLNVDKAARGCAFERWIYDLIKNVSGWDVVARPETGLA